MAVGNMHKTRKVQPCGFRVMQEDRQTDKQTNKQSYSSQNVAPQSAK